MRKTGSYVSMSPERRDHFFFIFPILFDHVSEVLHDRVPLNKVREITNKEYYVQSTTQGCIPFCIFQKPKIVIR